MRNSSPDARCHMMRTRKRVLMMANARKFLAHVARELGVSERTLNRAFRERVGTTPAAELRSLRLKRAMSLLRTTEFPLDYIAKAAGFSHAPHFVNSFRAAVGETPSAWRERWQE